MVSKLILNFLILIHFQKTESVCATESGDICPADEQVQERLASTARDRRSYIAISVEAGTDLQTIKRVLKNIFGRRNAYSDRYIAKLYNKFENRLRLNTDRCQVAGRAQTATDENHQEILNELITERRTWIVDQLVEVMGISRGSIHILLKNGGYRKIGSIWLPHELSEEDMQKRVRAARANLWWFERDARMLGRIIATDETWLRSYSPLDPQQARE